MRKIISTDKWDLLLNCSNPFLQHYKVLFDEKINEDGQYEYLEVEFNNLPNLDEIKKLIIDYYNKECDKEILSGLLFEDSQVWLSNENQFNYKSAFDFAHQTNGLNLPVTFKLGADTAPVYRTFETVHELQDFIIIIMTHINYTLNTYWNKKDSIDWSKYQI